MDSPEFRLFPAELFLDGDFTLGQKIDMLTRARDWARDYPGLAESLFDRLTLVKPKEYYQGQARALVEVLRLLRDPKPHSPNDVYRMVQAALHVTVLAEPVRQSVFEEIR